MIPKIIHYCWMSGEDYPEDIKKCIQSWKDLLPDYEIILWNSENFDVNICKYVREAYDNRKWAFVSDYVRLYALYHYGGIYLDSDIEVLKNLDNLLLNEAFTGFEDNDRIAAWIFGSEKNNPIFKEFLDHYTERSFVRPDGTFDMTPNPVPITKTLLKHGLILNDSLQELDHITVYPQDFFCPYNPSREPKYNFTSNTLVNHHFNGAWRGEEEHYLENCVKKMRLILPRKIAGYTARFITVLKFHGIYTAISSVKRWRRQKSGKENI